MSEEKDPGQKPVITVWQNPVIRKVVIAVVALLVAFLLGFIPMWLRARDSANRLAQAQHELKRASLENTLAAAAINARRGEYEQARQAASDFYTSLRNDYDNETNSPLTAGQKQNLNPLFARRDEIITLLARNDPAAADHLSEIYFSFRQIVNATSTPKVK